MILKTELGTMLREARQEADLTQLELAEKLGLEQSHIARWETKGMSSVVEFSRALDELGYMLSINYEKRGVHTLKAQPQVMNILEIEAEEVDGKLVAKSDNIRPDIKTYDVCKHGAIKGFCKKGCK